MPPAMAKKGHVRIHQELCKGCGECVHACPEDLLEISPRAANRLGYFPAGFLTKTCSACGLCLRACPEPGVLTIHPLC